MTHSGEDPGWHVITQAAAYLYPAALRAVVLLDVADHLVGGPRTPGELAELTGANAPFLRRVLRFLASRGTFWEDANGRFHLTPHADVLRADAPRSMRAGVLAVTSAQWWQSAGDLGDALRHGETPFDRRHGRPFFDYLAENPCEGALFHEGMASFAASHVEQIMAAYDFPDEGVVVDVGGGVGGLLLAMLRARPGLRGVLVDHENVVAAHVLGELEPDRWRLAPGDFFESVPAGDLYTIKSVLNDWTDDQCVQILSNCRRAMNPGATLLAIDTIIPPGNEPHFGKDLDVLLLLLLPGQERTQPEFEKLFAGAGLRISRVLRTPGILTMVEAAPISR